MRSNSELITSSGGLTPSTGTLARPALPRSTALAADRRRAVDLEERMDPLAVAEATADDDQSAAGWVGRFALIALAAAAVWWLLPRAEPARPPLEVPGQLQAEAGRIPPAQLAAEREAIALADRGLPTAALDAFRRCVDAEQPASVNLWRHYLQTLVDLDERGELRQRARQFAGRHPDRLEGPHFQAEAIRRDDIERHRERSLPWGSRTSPVYLREIDVCQDSIHDALAMLDRQGDDWSTAERTKWADLLYLDRARLHHHAWKCAGFPFADPHREQALEALRKLSDTGGSDSLSLRVDIYRRCLDAWPTVAGFPKKQQLVNGREQSRDDLRRALEADRAALEGAPPTGRR
jgi:hypothetical protein